jgi:integrase
MRVGSSELFKLRWADIDLVRRKLRVDAAKKNAHEQWRELPIREELVDLFRQWEAEDRLLDLAPLTVVHFKGRPVKSIKTAWRTMVKDSGVGRHLRPYDLRKFFGTELLANGIDVGTVSKMMGHTSPEMVLKHYQTVLDKRQREAVESLPLVSNFRCRTGNALDTLQ